MTTNSPDDSVQAHLDALQHVDPSVRLDAAIALQKIGGFLEKTLPVLIHDIAAVDEEHLRDWQWALKFIGRPAIAALAEKAADERAPVDTRLLALRTIASEFYQDHGAASDQMRRLLSGANELSAWAAVILAKNGQPVHAQKPFLAALQSDDDKLVEEALYAMHSFKSTSLDEVETVKGALLRCFVHPNDRVRGNCNMFVGVELNEEDLKRLNLQEDDPIDAVIGAICRNKSIPLAAIPILVKGLFLDDIDTSESLAPQALARLGAAAVEPVSQVALDGSNPPEARGMALFALSKMASLPPAIVDKIRPILEEPDEPHVPTLSRSKRAHAMMVLPLETAARIRAIFDHPGKPGVYAAIVLAKMGTINSLVLRKLIAGAINHMAGVGECLKRLPSEQVIPELTTCLRVTTDAAKGPLAEILSEIGFNSPDAAQAIVDEFAHAADRNLRNSLANSLRNFEELAVPPALKALTSYSRDEQIIWLLEGLEFVGWDAIAAVPHLLPLLKHRNPEVGFYAAKAIAAIEPANPAATPILLKALSSSDASRRFEVLNPLNPIQFHWMEESGAPFVARLIELLDEKEFREQATQVLGRFGTAAAPAIPKLVQLMLSSNDSSSFIQSLGCIQHPDAVPHLIAALDNERKVDAILGVFSGFRHHPVLAALVIDKLRMMLDGPYKLLAVKTLGQLGKVARPAEGEVVALLDDPEKDVRLAAIESLEGLEAAADRLLILVDNEDRDIRIAAIKALGGPKPVSAIPLLFALAESSDIEAAKAAISALGRYGKDAPMEFVSLLIRRFDESEKLQWAALYAFRDLGPQAAEAVPMIIPLLTKSIEFAFTVIEAIGPAASSALPTLERLLNTLWNRRLARAAIWKISPERAKELGIKPPFGL